METLVKSMLGQWQLLKSDDPHTMIHYSSGEKKRFDFKHQAVTHLLNEDYIYHNEGRSEFHHLNDHSKTAKVVLHPSSPKEDPKRRKGD